MKRKTLVRMLLVSATLLLLLTLHVKADPARNWGSFVQPGVIIYSTAAYSSTYIGAERRMLVNQDGSINANTDGIVNITMNGMSGGGVTVDTFTDTGNATIKGSLFAGSNSADVDIQAGVVISSGNDWSAKTAVIKSSSNKWSDSVSVLRSSSDFYSTQTTVVVSSGNQWSDDHSVLRSSSSQYANAYSVTKSSSNYWSNGVIPKISSGVAPGYTGAHGWDYVGIDYTEYVSTCTSAWKKQAGY